MLSDKALKRTIPISGMTREGLESLLVGDLGRDAVLGVQI